MSLPLPSEIYTVGMLKALIEKVLAFKHCFDSLELFLLSYLKVSSTVIFHMTRQK